MNRGAELQPGSRRHVDEIGSGGESCPARHPGSRPGHQATARDMCLCERSAHYQTESRGLTCSYRQRRPTEDTGPCPKFPTTSDTTLGIRGRRRRPGGAMSGPWSSLAMVRFRTDGKEDRLTNEDAHEKTPNADKENRNLNHDHPSRHIRDGPQELPVASVWTTEPIVAKDLREEEPNDELPPE